MNNITQYIPENQIDFVAPVFIPEVWYHVEELLNEGLAKTDDMMPIEAIYHKLAMGEYLLWTVQQDDILKGLALTEVVNTKDGKLCFIYFVTGNDFSSWYEDLHDGVLTWAQGQGCIKVKALGRIGWKKFYKNKGWQIDSVEFSFLLKHNLH